MIKLSAIDDEKKNNDNDDDDNKDNTNHLDEPPTYFKQKSITLTDEVGSKYAQEFYDKINNFDLKSIREKFICTLSLDEVCTS